MIYPRIRLFGHYISRVSMLLAFVEGLLLWALAHILLATQTSAQDQGVTALSWFATFIALISMVIFSSLGLYNRTIIANIQVMFVRFMVGLVLLSAASYLLIKIYLYFVPIPLFPPRHYFYLPTGIMLGLAAILCTRLLVIYILDLDVLKQRIVFIGGRDRAERLHQSILSDQSLGFEIAAVVDPDIKVREESVSQPAIWPFDESTVQRDTFWQLLGEAQADEIVVAVKDTTRIPVDTLLDCKSRGIRVSDYLSFVERELGRVDLEELDPNWLIFSHGFREDWLTDALQRTFDLVFSILLLVATAPVLLITAIMVRMDSPGPVFYRQERTGLHGRSFTLNKFRSMRTDAEAAGPQWAGTNDDRITDVGRFIRKTRIDELPQLFNVLSGEMSIIGPRPERPVFVESLAKQIPHYDQRHRVRPGITGWAQINYPYGASVEDAKEKLAYDLYYVKNRSLFLDIVILLQTVRVVLWPVGVR